MNVIEKNEGAKIPYEVNGSKICFDDDLQINLSKREEDYAVHIDICADSNGNLVIGTTSAHKYIAEIDIPERAYVETEVEAGDGEEPTKVKTPVPFDMSRVTLTLWAL